MSYKEILGFKEDNDNNNDSICPNCGCSFNIPIHTVEDKWFNCNHYDEYTCSNCGLQWRIKKNIRYPY